MGVGEILKKLFVLMVLAASPLAAQDKSFTRDAPETLIETGFLQHLLPRFSLKTGIRITIGTDGAEAAFGDTGTPVFQQDATLWHLQRGDDPDTDAFEAWLLSDVGKRTIEAFSPDGVALFSADVTAPEVAQVIEISGDAVLGEDVSLGKCGRCHVVNESNRMNAIGSTPSFRLLRTFDDWEYRFSAFFTLKPHPAFTQVEDVTAPFPENLPSPIAPIEVTLDEIDAILAYVATISPADLGAPVQSQ